MEREIVITGDGSHTLFVPQLGDHYHSVHGAIQESRHIFLQQGFLTLTRSPVRILEVGLGTGLNALLTVLEAIAGHREIYYEAWEAFPLQPDEFARLNYAAQLGEGHDLLEKIHQSPWSVPASLAPGITLVKIQEDIRNFRTAEPFNLVYFDAFGPDYQPELWETAVFERISEGMVAGARLVTYSAKGQVRRNLRAAGFRVEKAPGPPGKREITIAIKI